MGRRITLSVLCLVLVFSSSCLAANAAEERAVASQPVLEFNGTTALCQFRLVSPGKQISITMELWNGTSLIDSWSKSGSSIVSFNEQCSVVSGREYTLKVTGICDGKAISVEEVTKKCP